jgi:hypothetical protein
MKHISGCQLSNDGVYIDILGLAEQCDRVEGC